ncbi:hypothetical protein D3C73_15820 [compost metagenome]
MRFTATLEKTPGKGGWHYVRIPDDIHSGLREMSGKNGNVPVQVAIGKSAWMSTTMSMGEQRWFVAVKADVRKDENIFEGDEVSVGVAPDVDRLK